MGKKDIVYVLFKFSDTQFLGVGTTESIVLPQEYAKKNLTQQLLDIQSFINDKKKIGVKYEFHFHYYFKVDSYLHFSYFSWPVTAAGGFTEPTWSLTQSRRSSSYHILEAEIISFTGKAILFCFVYGLLQYN